MEKKIDIAAILKDCPKGMELDSLIHKLRSLLRIILNSYDTRRTNQTSRY